MEDIARRIGNSRQSPNEPGQPHDLIRQSRGSIWRPQYRRLRRGDRRWTPERPGAHSLRPKLIRRLIVRTRMARSAVRRRPRGRAVDAKRASPLRKERASRSIHAMRRVASRRGRPQRRPNCRAKTFARLQVDWMEPGASGPISASATQTSRRCANRSPQWREFLMTLRRATRLSPSKALFEI